MTHAKYDHVSIRYWMPEINFAMWFVVIEFVFCFNYRFKNIWFMNIQYIVLHRYYLKLSLEILITKKNIIYSFFLKYNFSNYNKKKIITMLNTLILTTAINIYEFVEEKSFFYYCIGDINIFSLHIFVDFGLVSYTMVLIF
jgi:hypothetical protein